MTVFGPEVSQSRDALWMLTKSNSSLVSSPKISKSRNQEVTVSLLIHLT